VLFPRRVVNAEPPAKGVQRGRRAGEFLPRDHQGIGCAGVGQGRKPRRLEFGIQELHVEGSVMDHQLRIADEIEKRLSDLGEFRLVAQEIIAKAVNLERLFWHQAFGADVLVIGFASRQVVKQFDRANFDDAVALRRLKPRGFGI
jgi:hypothetical protein